MSSGRFAIATHALAVLAIHEEGFSSDQVAKSIHTNPAFLRRVMAALGHAGIVEAREGRGGGYRLARPANRITLSEIYEAVEPEGAIAPSPCTPDARCRIGAGIVSAFEEIAKCANDGLLRGLATRTVADIARRAEQLGRKTA
jgi:Rrf2 family protein